METGEKALAVAVLNQALTDFVDGCKMYSEARKSLEKKGTLPNTYASTKLNFDQSVDLFIPKNKWQKTDLILWSEMAGSDAESITNRFKRVLEGEGKLGDIDYYSNIRDKWICEAYLHNDRLIKEEQKLKSFKKGTKDYKDCESKITMSTVEGNLCVKRIEEKLEVLEKRKALVSSEIFNEKIKDLKFILKIYREKSTGNKKSNIVYKYEQKCC